LQPLLLVDAHSSLLLLKEIHKSVLAAFVRSRWALVIQIKSIVPKYFI
jgi:hypothetical protein